MMMAAPMPVPRATSITSRYPRAAPNLASAQAEAFAAERGGTFGSGSPTFGVFHPTGRPLTGPPEDPWVEFRLGDRPVLAIDTRESYRNFQYVEFLALLWTGERWQIMHKCYHQFAGGAR